MMLGLFMLSFLPATAASRPAVHAYIYALLIGDVGHLGVTYAVLGQARFLDVGGWNAMTYGNVAVTVVLFSMRVGYLLGVFGQDRVPKEMDGPSKTK